MGRNAFGKRDRRELGIHSLRMGNAIGTHEVIFSTDTECITLKHEAQDRTLYAEGALRAAAFLIRQPPGLYDMEDLLRERSM
jgi:4-hydroxy-tetrahydrodipicolinate reductase